MYRMSTQNTILDETLDRWYEVRRGLIHEAKALPPARFSFKATLETRSVAEVLQHVLEYSIIVVEELVREDTNFHRASIPQLVNVYAPNITRADSQEKLLNLLVEQFQDAKNRLGAPGELHMMQYVARFDGTRQTRLSLLQEAIQHEMYHRGQLTVYTRLMGIEPVSTHNMRTTVTGSSFHSGEL